MSAPVRFPVMGPTIPRVGLEERPGAGIGASESPSGPALRDGGVERPFSEFLEAQVGQVNGLQKEADTAVAAMVTGQSGNLHETMIALDKADVSFRMMTRVRSKIIDAYHEVMRMNI